MRKFYRDHWVFVRNGPVAASCRAARGMAAFRLEADTLTPTKTVRSAAAIDQERRKEKVRICF